MNCVECPRIRDRYFDDICTPCKDKVKSKFGAKFWEQLRDCLNNLPSMKRLQEKREQWDNPRCGEAFAGELGCWPYHWFTFNCGGSDEAQFNVGMGPDYVRIGLGFQLNQIGQEKRKEVEGIYENFAERFPRDSKSKRFEELFTNKKCVVEWVSNKDEPRLRKGKLVPALGVNVHIEDAVSFFMRCKKDGRCSRHCLYFCGQVTMAQP